MVRKLRLATLFSAAYDTYGGPENCLALCKEWCRRAHYFFVLYVQAEVDEYEYTDAILASYEQQEEWLDFITAIPIESPAFDKVVETVRLLPNRIKLDSFF